MLETAFTPFTKNLLEELKKIPLRNPPVQEILEKALLLHRNLLDGYSLFGAYSAINGVLLYFI